MEALGTLTRRPKDIIKTSTNDQHHDGQQQQRLTFKLALADEGAGGAGGDLRAFHRQNESGSWLTVDHAARGRPLALSTSQLLCKMTITALVILFVILAR